MTPEFWHVRLSLSPLLAAIILLLSPLTLPAAPEARVNAPIAADNYRGFAITAGAVGGWLAAGLVADGLLLSPLAPVLLSPPTIAFPLLTRVWGALFGGVAVDIRYTGR